MKNKYKIIGDTTIIFIKYKDKILRCYVDTEDLKRINDFSKTTWHINMNRSNHLDGVKTKVQVNNIRTQYWLHNLILNNFDNTVVDHFDGNTLNNKKSNLRIVTKNENATNIKIKKKSTSGHRNVTKDNNKFRVIFNKNGVRYDFGRYDTVKEAKIIADKNRNIIFPLSRKY